MAVQAHAQAIPGVVHTLFVDAEGQNLRYQYMCRAGETVPPLATFQKSVERTDIQALTTEMSQVLARGAGSRSGDSDLRPWGGKLFDRLIPQELSDTFRSATRASYLVLYLDPALAWIPWELLWDGDEFFCRRFLLARLLQKSGTELRAAEQRLKEERSGRGSLIVFGDVSGLDARDEKIAVEKNLSGMYGTNTWFYTARSAADVLEELKKDYEICHFVGHGEFHADHPGQTGWKFSDGSVLTCQDIEAVSSRAAFPLLIFANSCDSARPAIPDAQNYITTLHRSFLRQGVPHYIGTAARIPDNLSKEFALCFYRMLSAGSSVGEALGEARKLFSAESGIPIWAYYIHYGDPTYRFLEKKALGSAQAPVPGLQDILDYESASVAQEPFVDREKEILDATEYIKRLAQGQSAVLFISGEAGVGKSAFLRRICREALQQAGDLAIAVGTCNLQLGLTDPYLPFKEIVRSLIRDSTRLPLPQGEARTVGELALTELVLSFPQLMPVFRPDVSLGKNRWEKIVKRLDLCNRPEDESLAGLTQTAIFDQVSRLLRRISGAVRLILVVDNLHWADDSSVALFFHLGRTLADGRILLMGSYRSDLLRRGRTAGEHPLKHALNELRRYGAHTISLDLSTAKAGERKRIQGFVAAYAGHALPGHRLPPSFLDKLAERTGGNALFLTELVRYAREKGQIIQRDGRWELSTDVEQLELPESVESIIEERIAQLSEELKETLTLASVEGEDFTAEVLARVQDLDEDRILGRLLEDLHQIHQLVDERGEREISPERVLSLFHFRSSLVQQHVYQDLGVAQRRRVHKKVGECLEELYGEKRMEVAGQLAAHFRIAREVKKALHYAIEAAKHSKSIYASREAIRNYRMALELWELTSEGGIGTKVTLLLELGEVYKYVGSFDDAIATFEQVVRLGEGSEFKSPQAYALNGLGDAYRARGEHHKALPYYERCESFAKDLADECLLVEVWTDLTHLFYWLWKDAMATRLTEEAQESRNKATHYGAKVLQGAERLSMWENLRRVHVSLGSFMLKDRRFPEAEKFYLKATALADEHNLVKKSLCNLGELRREQGKYDEALEHYTAYLDWALKTGAVRHELIAYHNMGMVHLAKEDYERARDFFNKALELNRTVRDRVSGALSLAMKGLTFELQGAPSAATEFYRESLNALDIHSTDAELYGKVGRMLDAYEPQAAAYFLTKYLEQSPQDSEEIQKMLAKSRAA